MRFKRRIGILTYIFFDYVTAMLVWAGFFFYRKFYIEDYPINIKQQILKDEKELSLIKRKIFQGENYLKILDNKIEKARRVDNLEEADRLDLEKLDINFSLDNFKKDYIILEEKIEKYKKEHPIKIKNKEEELKTSIVTDTYESATEKLGRHARKNEYGGKLSSAGKESRNLDGKEY